MRQPFPAPFSFFEGVEGLDPWVRAIQTALEESDAYRLCQARAQADAALRVRKLITFSRSEAGRWKAKRAYLSFQPAGDLCRTGFRGETFFLSSRAGELKHRLFPGDPKLLAARQVLSRLEQGDNDPVKVLRYVPLRRLTLRGLWEPGAPDPAVVKVIENGGVAHIAAKLEAIQDATRRAGASFSVAAPLAHDQDASTFVQTCLPGAPLSDLMRAGDLEAVLRRVGAIHAEVHGLPAAPAGCAPVADPYPTVVDRLDWLRFVRPRKTGLLDEMQARLDASRPDPGRARTVFCHGDFRCTQVLAEGEGWSVIDFDDAGMGDACQDLGRFLAFLKYDVPFLGAAAGGDPAPSAMLERAEAAYLEGYADRCGAMPDPRSLLWHRSCQEILYLSQRLRRDLADEMEFEASCNLIRRLAGGLPAH